jgi:hypothetical protein
MEDQAVGENSYAVAGNDSGVDELGQTFVVGTHGFTKAPYILVISRYKFMLDAFLGDGVEDEFVLSQTVIPADAHVNVSVGGVLKTVTTHYTVDTATYTITFTGGNIPASGAKIIVEYEYS